MGPPAPLCVEVQPPGGHDFVVLVAKGDAALGDFGGAPEWLLRLLRASVRGNSFATAARTPEGGTALVIAESHLSQVEIPDAVRIDREWAALRLDTSELGRPDAIGALAGIIDGLTSAGQHSYVVSTPQSEHLLIKASKLGPAAAALSRAGYAVSSASRICSPPPSAEVKPFDDTCRGYAGVYSLVCRHQSDGTVSAKHSDGDGPIRIQSTSGLYVEVRLPTAVLEGDDSNGGQASCGGRLIVERPTVVQGGIATMRWHRLVDFQPPNGEAPQTEYSLDGTVLTEGSLSGGRSCERWARLDLGNQIVVLQLESEIPAREASPRSGLWLFCGWHFARIIGLPCGEGLIAGTCCNSLVDLERLRGTGAVRAELVKHYEALSGFVEPSGALKIGQQAFAPHRTGKPFYDENAGVGGKISIISSGGGLQQNGKGHDAKPGDLLVHTMPRGKEQRWRILEWTYDPFSARPVEALQVATATSKASISRAMEVASKKVQLPSAMSGSPASRANSQSTSADRKKKKRKDKKGKDRRSRSRSAKKKDKKAKGSSSSSSRSRSRDKKKKDKRKKKDRSQSRSGSSSAKRGHAQVAPPSLLRDLGMSDPIPSQISPPSVLRPPVLRPPGPQKDVLEQLHAAEADSRSLSGAFEAFERSSLPQMGKPGGLKFDFMQKKAENQEGTQAMLKKSQMDQSKLAAVGDLFKNVKLKRAAPEPAPAPPPELFKEAMAKATPPPPASPMDSTATPFAPTESRQSKPSQSPFVPSSTPGVPSSTPGVPSSTPGVPSSTPGVPSSTPGVDGKNVAKNTLKDVVDTATPNQTEIASASQAAPSMSADGGLPASDMKAAVALSGLPVPGEAKSASSKEPTGTVSAVKEDAAKEAASASIQPAGMPANFAFPQGYPPPDPAKDGQAILPQGFAFPQGYPPPDPAKQAEAAGLPQGFAFPQGYPPPKPGEPGMMPAGFAFPHGYPPPDPSKAGEAGLPAMLPPGAVQIIPPPGLPPGAMAVTPQGIPIAPPGMVLVSPTGQILTPPPPMPGDPSQVAMGAPPGVMVPGLGMGIPIMQLPPGSPIPGAPPGMVMVPPGMPPPPGMVMAAPGDPAAVGQPMVVALPPGAAPPAAALPPGTSVPTQMPLSVPTQMPNAHK